MIQSKERALRLSRQWAWSIFRGLFIITMAFILIYPILFIVSESVKSVRDVYDPAVTWFAKHPQFGAFKYAFEVLKYPESLWNTVSMELVSAVLEVFSCAVAAYGMARFNSPIKKLQMFLLILVIFVPDIVMIIPRIETYRNLDLFGILGLVNNITGVDIRPNILDTPLVFWLPSLFGVGLKGGLFIFMYMQFFKGLPAELEEAAWIDGAGPVQTFARIVLPSSGVIMLTVFIFSFIWHWNDSFLALMYTTDRSPLAVMLQDINQYVYMSSGEWPLAIRNNLNGVYMAACLLFLLPPLVMYLILQRKFIQSIDRVGIVG